MIQDCPKSHVSPAQKTDPEGKNIHLYTQKAAAPAAQPVAPVQPLAAPNPGAKPCMVSTSISSMRLNVLVRLMHCLSLHSTARLAQGRDATSPIHRKSQRRRADLVLLARGQTVTSHIHQAIESRHSDLHSARKRTSPLLSVLDRMEALRALLKKAIISKVKKMSRLKTVRCPRG